LAMATAAALVVLVLVVVVVVLVVVVVGTAKALSCVTKVASACGARLSLYGVCGSSRSSSKSKQRSPPVVVPGVPAEIAATSEAVNILSVVTTGMGVGTDGGG
jgi:hypothetical protein